MTVGTWEEVAGGDRWLPSLHNPIHSLNRSS